MLKTLTHPSGRTLKMGRKRPVARHLGLKLGSYLTGDVEPPSAVDYAPAATACLDQMMLNDQLGDCTAAAAFHIEGVLRGNAGTPVKFSNAQVEAFYAATTGYVPGKPETDQGGDETTVLNFWRDHGLYVSGRGVSTSTPSATQHGIIGHLQVDARDAHQVQSAAWLFENLYFGVSLPDAWVNPMPNGPGWTWGVAGDPDDENGHAFCGVGYDVQTGVRICSWGMLGTITWDAIAKYAVAGAGGELHAVLSLDAIDKATNKAPNAVAYADLLNDFERMGGNVPASVLA